MIWGGGLSQAQLKRNSEHRMMGSLLGACKSMFILKKVNVRFTDRRGLLLVSVPIVFSPPMTTVKDLFLKKKVFV